MKWLLATICALTLVGCSASASAVQLARDTTTQSVETQMVTTVTTDSLDHKVKTFMDKQTEKLNAMKHNQKRINKVVKQLKKQVGRTPYVYSGSGLYGWDCSGLVVWTYEQLGIHVEHSATKQGYSGKRVKEPKVGDIVVFGYKGSKSFYHSAIYIGDGKIVNANYGLNGTVIQSLSDQEYQGKKIRFIRFIDTP